MTISRLWSATAAATGVLFVISVAFGVTAALSPYAQVEPTSSSAAIAEALTAGTNNLITGNYVLLMAAFLMVAFSGYLRSVIGPTGGRGWPASVGFGGGVLTAALLSFIALIGISQGQVADYGSDTVVAKTLLILGWASVSVLTPGLAAFAGGMSLMSLASKSLPRWLGWLGFLATVLLLTIWALGILVALAWIAAVSVIFVIREVRAEEVQEDETSPA